MIVWNDRPTDRLYIYPHPTIPPKTTPTPPGLKIYPTLVIRGTGLYELWRTGRYRNYTPDELVDLVAKILALVPPWTRVYRIQRCVAIYYVRCCVWVGGGMD